MNEVPAVILCCVACCACAKPTTEALEARMRQLEQRVRDLQDVQRELKYRTESAGRDLDQVLSEANTLLAKREQGVGTLIMSDIYGKPLTLWAVRKVGDTSWVVDGDVRLVDGGKVVRVYEKGRLKFGDERPESEYLERSPFSGQ